MGIAKQRQYGVFLSVIARSVATWQSQELFIMRRGDCHACLFALLGASAKGMARNDDVVCPLPVIPNLFRNIMVWMLKWV